MSLPVPQKPSRVGEFKLSSEGYECQLPDSVDMEEERSATVYMNRPDGAMKALRTRATSLDPIELTLSGVVSQASVVRDLKRVIGRGTLTVHRRDRELASEVSEFYVRPVTHDGPWFFELSVESTNSYWTSPERRSESNPSFLVNNGDLDTLPLLQLTGGSGGADMVEVDIEGKVARYEGALGFNQILEVDCEAMTATLDGVPVLGSFNSSFFTNPPRLFPGVNNVSMDFIGAASLRVIYTERYL